LGSSYRAGEERKLLGWLDARVVLGRIMSCGVLGVTPEWVQRQHRDHGFGEGRGKYSGRWGKVSQSEGQGNVSDNRNLFAPGHEGIGSSRF